MQQYGVGFYGAQRVGKTTLAKKYATVSGVEYIRVSASDVIVQQGYDVKIDYDVGTRLMLQEAVLKQFCKQWAEAASSGKVFVTDRTPLDLWTYMLADVQRSFPKWLEARLAAYGTACIEAYDTYFCHTFLVQPGIPLTEADTSAPASPAYMMHFNTIALGTASTLDRISVMPKYLTDLEERLAYVLYRTTLARSSTLPTTKLGK